MGVGSRVFQTFLFNKTKKEDKQLTGNIPFPKYRNYIEFEGRGYWQCNRCGCLVADSDIDLHHEFHGVQDRLLEKLMIALDRTEPVVSKHEPPTGSDPLS